MPRPLYIFGQFSVDLEARILYRDGERVPVPPKAADLLLALVEREGQVVTKDELLRQVWPDTFVEEGNLARHISLLRKVLGENGDGSSYLETVPKRGYRFVRGAVNTGETTVITSEERTSERITIEEIDTPDAASRLVGNRTVALLLGMFTVAALIGSFVWIRTRGAAPVRSVLVLPFANLSADGDSEYFSDGLTEELIAAFSSVNGLRVIPRTTAFQFKGKSGDLLAIGSQLQVDAVLDGGVRREGERLRIHLSLTRVKDGHTIWSRTFDGKTENAFDTQEEIASDVLRAMFPRDQRASYPLSPSGTKNPEAQLLFLKGNFIWQRYVNASPIEALALFERATTLDPNYADAWAGKAFCYAALATTYERYPKDVMPLAIQASDRALALNTRLALAHAIRGQINLVFLRDWQGANRELERATELNPNSGEGHHWMSHLWVSLGRFKEAYEEGRRAIQSDPLNAAFAAHMAWTRIMDREYEAALRAAQDALQLDSGHTPGHIYRMLAYEGMNRYPQALEARRIVQPDSARLWETSHGPIENLEKAIQTQGAVAYWKFVLHGLETRQKNRPTGPTDFAKTYARLGDRDRALDWLERAVEERDHWAIYMKVEPAFEWLRNDARFLRIVKSAGIP